MQQEDLSWDSQQGLPNTATTELRTNEREGPEVKRREEMKAEGAAAKQKPDGLHHTQQGSQLTLPGFTASQRFQCLGQVYITQLHASLGAAVTIWGLPAGTWYSVAQNWAHTGSERRLHTSKIF